MADNNLNTDTYLNEANAYFNKLSNELGHANEQQKVMRIWRAVMHALRDRITISESFDLMAQLPVILRGIYAEQWKYSEKPALDYQTVAEMKEVVKNLQERYGEKDFNWNKPTEEIISISINSMSEFLTDGQLDHIRDQMPKEVKGLVGS